MGSIEVTADRWLTIRGTEARAVASAVARHIRAAAVDVRPRCYGGRTVWNVRLLIGSRWYAYVPGGEVTLGYDARTFTPTAAELESYVGIDPDPLARYGDGEPPEPEPGPIDGQLDLFVEADDRSSTDRTQTLVGGSGRPDGTGEAGRTGEAGGMGGRPDAPDARIGVEALRGFLAWRVTPPRTVQVPHLLVAIDPVEAGATAVPLDHPLVTALVRATPRHRGMVGIVGPRTADPGEPQVRVELSRYTSELTRAFLLANGDHASVVEALAVTGERLPTPDEWEHAFGPAGGTLFTWGDRCPDRSYPDAGRDQLPDGTLVDLSASPFGLRRVVGGYPELTADPAEVRAFDDHAAACDRLGLGRFHRWLLRAPAHRDPAENGRVASSGNVRDAWMRPVREI